MSRSAVVYNNRVVAGTLEKTDSAEYIFRYDPAYLNSPLPAISLSFPKTNSEYKSKTLFPFFFGLLSEGINKQTQCRLLRIDENDHFTRLINTASSDTIGAITVKETP